MANLVIVYILSGEGEEGQRVEYTGTRTARALKSRLTRERCSGDRWARAEVSVDTDHGIEYLTCDPDTVFMEAERAGKPTSIRGGHDTAEKRSRQRYCLHS